MDALKYTEMKYERDPEYQRLNDAARGKYGGPECEAWYEYIMGRRREYGEKLLQIKARNPEYALVIKDGEDVVMGGTALRPTRTYDLLNELSSGATVVVMGRNQNAIRHEDWDKVEMGGFRIIPSESGALMRCFSFDGQSIKGGLYSHLVTGDRVNFLSNIDGVFIWPASR